MGIRGDMEIRFWGEVGEAKTREIVEHFFECLKDPNAWQRMQRELELTDEETSTFLHCVDWMKEKMVTHAN